MTIYNEYRLSFTVFFLSLTMKQKILYIIRHGKAEEFSFGKGDFDRGLIGPGIKRAQKHALMLKEEFAQRNDKILILSSTAVRAAQTARIFADTLDYPAEMIQWAPSIYEAHYLQILKSINDVSANYDYLLVFGHNPGLSDLVAYTSNQYVELKTASIACLTIENGLDYSTLSANTATLNKVISS